MEDGLYSLDFSAHDGSSGSGVAVFNGTRVLGGDSTYFYEGTVSPRAGNTFEANVVARRHQATGVSIFGNLDVLNLRLSGEALGPRFTLNGHVEELPQARITVVCRKLAEL